MKLPPPPDWKRDAFREHLISEEGRNQLASLADEIAQLNFYLQTLDGFVSDQKAAAIAAIQRDSAHLPDEARQEYLAWHYPIHWDDIFLARIYASFVVVVCSFVEGRLSDGCRSVEIIDRTPVELSQLRGPMLERARIMLERIGKMQCITPDLWQKIGAIFAVRNIVVHNSGFISDRLRKNVAPLLDAGVIRESHSSIVLDKDFCLHSLSVARDLLQGAEKGVAEICQRYKHGAAIV